MADLWGNVRQSVGNWADSLGTALGLPETGWSEKIAGGPTVNTKMGGQGIARADEGPISSQMAPGIYDSNGNKIGSSDRVIVNPPAGGGNSGGGGQPQAKPLPQGFNVKDKNSNPGEGYFWDAADGWKAINAGADSQQAAAERAAEARRRAAEGRYNAQKSIAESAKGMAKESYDWLVDTIGSNKQDLLSQVALNEKSGLADYQMNEDKTRKDYDKAKTEILTTYRDLQTQQEKILRGSGMGSSSRSQEAQLKLNNLLGKDLSTVRTNEADSLAMIGNALTKFKDGILQTNNSIEREATGKLDKAALDYKQQITGIDNNLTLSASEREDAYAAAEEQLARDSQQITQWATGLKVQAQQFQAEQQGKIDDFIANMLDENTGLNMSLDEKRAKTNEIITQSGFTPLDSSSVANPTSGVYQKAKMSYKDKDALDAALQKGEITPSDYNLQLQQIQANTGTGSTIASAANPAGATINPRGMSAQRDPLLSALFA